MAFGVRSAADIVVVIVTRARAVVRFGANALRGAKVALRWASTRVGKVSTGAQRIVGSARAGRDQSAEVTLSGGNLVAGATLLVEIFAVACRIHLRVDADREIRAPRAV